ncbi:MAG TPA: hypothetical protein VFS54_11735 [Solirubrobacterales bacterium]|nr:hypothetical protein [Solirubrobacterales bacterium]
MNHLKKTVPVGALVIALMATVGVGSAAAEQSTFCKANETPCGSGNHYPSGSTFVLKSKGPFRWVSYILGSVQIRKFECQEGEFKGQTSTTGGSAQTVEVAFKEQFIFACGGPITTNQLMKMKFAWTSGTMNGSALTSGLDYTFDGTGGPCRYNGEVKGTLTGGNPAVLDFNEVPVTVSGSGCGTTATFDGEFEVSTPKPLYVSNG